MAKIGGAKAPPFSDLGKIFDVLQVRNIRAIIGKPVSAKIQDAHASAQFKVSHPQIECEEPNFFIFEDLTAFEVIRNSFNRGVSERQKRLILHKVQSDPKRPVLTDPPISHNKVVIRLSLDTLKVSDLASLKSELIDVLFRSQPFAKLIDSFDEFNIVPNKMKDPTFCFVHLRASSDSALLDFHGLNMSLRRVPLQLPFLNARLDVSECFAIQLHPLLPPPDEHWFKLCFSSVLCPRNVTFFENLLTSTFGSTPRARVHMGLPGFQSPTEGFFLSFLLKASQAQDALRLVVSHIRPADLLQPLESACALLSKDEKCCASCGQTGHVQVKCPRRPRYLAAPRFGSSADGAVSRPALQASEPCRDHMRNRCFRKTCCYSHAPQRQPGSVAIVPRPVTSFASKPSSSTPASVSSSLFLSSSSSSSSSSSAASPATASLFSPPCSFSAAAACDVSSGSVSSSSPSCSSSALSEPASFLELGSVVALSSSSSATAVQIALSDPASFLESVSVVALSSSSSETAIQIDNASVDSGSTDPVASSTSSSSSPSPQPSSSSILIPAGEVVTALSGAISFSISVTDDDARPAAPTSVETASSKSALSSTLAQQVSSIDIYGRRPSHPSQRPPLRSLVRRLEEVTERTTPPKRACSDTAGQPFSSVPLSLLSADSSSFAPLFSPPVSLLSSPSSASVASYKHALTRPAPAQPVSRAQFPACNVSPASAQSRAGSRPAAVSSSTPGRKRGNRSGGVQDVCADAADNGAPCGVRTQQLDAGLALVNSLSDDALAEPTPIGTRLRSRDTKMQCEESVPTPTHKKNGRPDKTKQQDTKKTQIPDPTPLICSTPTAGRPEPSLSVRTPHGSPNPTPPDLSVRSADPKFQKDTGQQYLPLESASVLPAESSLAADLHAKQQETKKPKIPNPTPLICLTPTAVRPEPSLSVRTPHGSPNPTPPDLSVRSADPKIQKYTGQQYLPLESASVLPAESSLAADLHVADLFSPSNWTSSPGSSTLASSHEPLSKLVRTAHTPAPSEILRADPSLEAAQQRKEDSETEMEWSQEAVGGRKEEGPTAGADTANAPSLY